MDSKDHSARAETVADCWERFRRSLVAPHASAAQLWCLHQAFMAGACETLRLVQAVAQGGLAKPVGVRRLEALYRECAAFADAQCGGDGATEADA